MSDQQKQTPTDNNSALHEAAGNLAFLLSVIRCGDVLTEAEILNVRKVIERCAKEETQLAEAQAQNKFISEALQLVGANPAGSEGDALLNAIRKLLYQLAEANRWVAVWKGRDTEAWNYLAKELGHDPNATDPSGYHNAVTTFGLAQQAIRERNEARASVEGAENAINHCPALKDWNPSTLEHHASRVTFLCNLYDGCVHTLGLICDQRDALAKALNFMITCNSEETAKAWNQARESLAALEQPRTRTQIISDLAKAEAAEGLYDRIPVNYSLDEEERPAPAEGGKA